MSVNMSWTGGEEQERLFTIKLTRKEKLALESLIWSEIQRLKAIDVKTDQIREEWDEEIKLHEKILKKLEEV